MVVISSTWQVQTYCSQFIWVQDYISVIHFCLKCTGIHQNRGVKSHDEIIWKIRLVIFIKNWSRISSINTDRLNFLFFPSTCCIKYIHIPQSILKYFFLSTYISYKYWHMAPILNLLTLSVFVVTIITQTNALDLNLMMQ
jgi:hypothetical protein